MSGRGCADGSRRIGTSSACSRQLATAARSWEENGRDDADLYRGTRLAAAVERIGDERQLSRVEREFLEASRDAQERELTSAQRRARRLRALARGRRGGARGGGDRGILRARPTRKRPAHGDCRAGRTPRRPVAGGRGAAPRPRAPARARGRPPRRLGRHAAARCWARSSTARGSVRGSRGSTRPSSRRRSAPTARSSPRRRSRGPRSTTRGPGSPVGPPLRSSQGGYSGVDFSPDGRTLAIAGGEGRVELWDVATRKERRELTDPAARRPASPALSVVRYSPDGAVIAAGPQETNHVTLWATATGRVIGRPITVKPPGSGGAQRISFSPDSKRIAVPGAPGTVGIWEVATGRRVGKPLAIGSDDVEAAIFADGGRTVIASDDSGSVSMVDVATGRPIRTPLSVGDEPADSLDLSPDGRLLAAATFGGSVFVWNAKTGAAVRLPAHGRHEPGQRGRVQPRRPDPRERAPALGGRLEHGRGAGDRRAVRRRDRSDHRRVLQSRRHAARRRAVRRGRGRVRHGDATAGPSAARSARSSPPSPSLPTGSTSPSERSTAGFGSSIRAAGAAVGSPARREECSRLAGRVQPGRSAARGRRGSERWR